MRDIYLESLYVPCGKSDDTQWGLQFDRDMSVKPHSGMRLKGLDNTIAVFSFS